MDGSVVLCSLSNIFYLAAASATDFSSKSNSLPALHLIVSVWMEHTHFESMCGLLLSHVLQLYLSNRNYVVCISRYLQVVLGIFWPCQILFLNFQWNFINYSLLADLLSNQQTEKLPGGVKSDNKTEESLCTLGGFLKSNIMFPTIVHSATCLVSSWEAACCAVYIML